MQTYTRVVTYIVGVAICAMSLPGLAQNRDDGIYPHSDPLTPEQRRIYNAQPPATKPAPAAQQPLLREIAVGMTKDEVLTQTRGYWRYPKSKHVTRTSYGVREQWTYTNGDYLYFENGVVTSIVED